MKKILPFLFLVWMLTSCGSRIGAGISSNRGNMLLESYEGNKKGTGMFVGYGYQKMFDRHGVGADFEFSFRGYQTDCFECYEGTDYLFHSIQAKYYFTLIEKRHNPFRLDLAAGVGTGKFTLNSRDKYYPTILSAGVDFYFTKNELIYLSHRLKYMNHLKSDEYQMGFELGVGLYFKGDDDY